jgi:hypothetical protein
MLVTTHPLHGAIQLRDRLGAEKPPERRFFHLGGPGKAEQFLPDQLASLSRPVFTGRDV